ncbi:MAG TPA: GNAT family N-acetyltransferase [Aquabacterium sp.]|nr:GNAT family N-acetyltransferase [Aquabacterium sp.]
MTSPILRAPFAAPFAQPLCRIPSDLAASWRLANGTPVQLRPVLPKDGPGLANLVAGLSKASRHARFPGAAEALSAAQLAELTELDFDHHVGFVITVPDEGGERIIGEARFMVDGNTGSADITLVVADAWQRHGIGTQALLAIARAAARRGLRWLRCDVACSNRAALTLLHHCGFTRTPHPEEDDMVQLHLLLLPPFPG